MFGTALVAAAPKCPLCVIAYLSLFSAGLGAALAESPLVPVALGLAFAAALFAFVARRRRLAARREA